MIWIFWGGFVLTTQVQPVAELVELSRRWAADGRQIRLNDVIAKGGTLRRTGSLRHRHTKVNDNRLLLVLLFYPVLLNLLLCGPSRVARHNRPLPKRSPSCSFCCCLKRPNKQLFCFPFSFLKNGKNGEWEKKRETEWRGLVACLRSVSSDSLWSADYWVVKRRNGLVGLCVSHNNNWAGGGQLS